MAERIPTIYCSKPSGLFAGNVCVVGNSTLRARLCFGGRQLFSFVYSGTPTCGRACTPSTTYGISVLGINWEATEEVLLLRLQSEQQHVYVFDLPQFPLRLPAPLQKNPLDPRREDRVMVLLQVQQVRS